MRRTVGFAASILALLLLASSISAKAETLTAVQYLSPANEVPPITGLNATGGFAVTIVINRDANGAITGGTVTFLGTVSFPGAVTITGLHIHEGSAIVSAGVVINSGISAANPIVLPTGSGLIQLPPVTVTNTALLERILKNPAGFYVNLHTTVNPGGAIRGQIVRLVETQAATVQLSTANEVPPVTNATGSGVATITINPIRRPETGEVIGGSVTFSMVYGDFAAPTNITGLHIHEAPAGMNGGIVIATTASGANPIALADGKGTYSFTVPITTAAQIGALRRLLANPAGFYVNAHTAANPGGVIRGQLVPLADPPIIQQSNTYFLETGSANAQVALLITGIDLASTVLVNGTAVQAGLDINTGGVNVTIPAALRTNAGTLFVQARNANGLQSAPLIIPVAAAASVNATPITTTDAAKFSTAATPESIVAGFGTRLASQTVSATTLPLPTVLDGTSVFVNGVAARLVFVSANQVNYLIPINTVVGPTAIVVVARDGTVSRGLLNVVQSNAAVFTSNSQGTGAPAAVASADGQVFNILMGNADGTPREVAAGNFVALFATGVRFASTAMTMTIGATNVTPLFVGAQGSFDGLDQINLQIPQSMAGAGEVNLTFTIDGKNSNPVRLRIR